MRRAKTTGMTKLHNRKELREFRKRLRTNSTPAEIALWKMLNRGKLEGRKFRRQHSVGNYIVDFYCATEQLAIELDGEGHFTEGGLAYDKERDEYLLSCGIRTLRFENNLVLSDPVYVLQEIKNNFTTTTNTSPPC